MESAQEKPKSKQKPTTPQKHVTVRHKGRPVARLALSPFRDDSGLVALRYEHTKQGEPPIPLPPPQPREKKREIRRPIIVNPPPVPPPQEEHPLFRNQQTQTQTLQTSQTITIRRSQAEPWKRDSGAPTSSSITLRGDEDEEDYIYRKLLEDIADAPSPTLPPMQSPKMDDSSFEAPQELPARKIPPPALKLPVPLSAGRAEIQPPASAPVSVPGPKQTPTQQQQPATTPSSPSPSRLGLRRAVSVSCSSPRSSESPSSPVLPASPSRHLSLTKKLGKKSFGLGSGSSGNEKGKTDTATAAATVGTGISSRVSVVSSGGSKRLRKKRVGVDRAASGAGTVGPASPGAISGPERGSAHCAQQEKPPKWPKTAKRTPETPPQPNAPGAAHGEQASSHSNKNKSTVADTVTSATTLSLSSAPTITTPIPSHSLWDDLDSIAFSKRGSLMLLGRKSDPSKSLPLSLSQVMSSSSAESGPSDCRAGETPNAIEESKPNVSEESENTESPEHKETDKNTSQVPASSSPSSSSSSSTSSSSKSQRDSANVAASPSARDAAKGPEPAVPSIRVSSIDLERESQKVRSLYESGDDLFWEDGGRVSFVERLAPTAEVPSEEDEHAEYGFPVGFIWPRVIPQSADRACA